MDHQGSPSETHLISSLNCEQSGNIRHQKITSDTNDRYQIKQTLKKGTKQNKNQKKQTYIRTRGKKSLKSSEMSVGIYERSTECHKAKRKKQRMKEGLGITNVELK